MAASIPLGLKSLHLDLWSAGEGTVKLFLISPGPSQAAVTLRPERDVEQLRY